MSKILRRPMFRGGPVDSRGTGITSGLTDKPKRGLVDEPGGYAGYGDILAQTQFNQNRERNKQFTYQSVLDRMNDYYNKLYTGGVNEDDFKGTFDGINYDKKMKTIGDQFDKYNKTGLENPYRKPPGVEETLETGTGNGNGNVTGDVVKKLSDGVNSF